MVDQPSNKSIGSLLFALLFLMGSTCAAFYTTWTLWYLLTAEEVCFKNHGCRTWSTDAWSLGFECLVTLFILIPMFGSFVIGSAQYLFCHPNKDSQK